MSLLNKIVTGKKRKPIAALLFGVEGIGKSSWASNAPKPIYIGAEENDELDVARFPRANCWQDVLSQIDTLLKDKHDFKTVVIDTLDSVEKLLHQHIVNEDDANSMTKAMKGYGRAYEFAAEQMTLLRDSLANLRDKKNMNVILLAHANKVKFDDGLLLQQYDTYEMKLHKKTNPLFREWVSAVLFANFIVHKTENDDGRTYAVGMGERKVFTQKRPGHDGKNRYNLPYEMPLDWNVFEKGVNDYFENGGSEVEGVRNEIRELAKGVDKEMQQSVQKFIDDAGNNMAKLEACKQRLLNIGEK